MIVKKRIKRPMTQKEMAKQFNCSISTVKNYIALPREEYEKEAKERRFKAYELKQQGLKLAEIAEALDCSYYAVAGLIKRYKQQDLRAK
ncbi:TPA: plasmid replication protein [Proteus mirabilis]|nr:plasmid replication protein [Proteus mirabilis]